MATLEPQKYVTAKTVWTEIILLVSGRLVIDWVSHVFKEKVISPKNFSSIPFRHFEFYGKFSKKPLIEFKRSETIALSPTF